MILSPAGGQAQEWQSLWRPSSAPQVQQSGTSCVLVHQSKGLAGLAKSVTGAFLVTMTSLEYPTGLWSLHCKQHQMARVQTRQIVASACVPHLSNLDLLFASAGATELTLLKLDQVGEGHQIGSTVVHTGLEYWAGQGDS